jgi:hypothetical protein
MQEVDRLEQVFRYLRPAALDQSKEEVKRQKLFYAGLRTHEEQMIDFLVYRATVFMPSSTRWTWSPGDDLPAFSANQFNIPMLSDELTKIPDEIFCPISHDVMTDAVKAADGHIYSRHALRQWFTIRKSSPLHGTTLDDTSMSERWDVISTASH